MATISAQSFFGDKIPAPPTNPVIHTPETQVPAAGIGERINNAAEGVTNFLGLHKAVDTIGTNLAYIAHPNLMTDSGIPQTSLKDNLKAGAEIGLATAGPEATGAAAKVGQVASKAAARLTGKGVEATGQKIQQAVIRPTIADIKDGFKIENVAKYDVGGSLPQTIAKAHVKMNELTQELAAKLKGSDAKINLNDTIAETAQRLAGDKASSFGDNAALDRVLEQIAAEVKHVGGGNVDLVTATNVKRGAGSKGAWAYNRPEADASAIERAYTEFYDVLKGQIEQAAPAGVKEINKQLSELIPIQNAALRRLPVEQRNNIFSLTDSIGFMSALFDPKALLLVGASKAAKSGKVGNLLTKAGRSLQGK
jgi:hypothetical protein